MYVSYFFHSLHFDFHSYSHVHLSTSSTSSLFFGGDCCYLYLYNNSTRFVQTGSDKRHGGTWATSSYTKWDWQLPRNSRVLRIYRIGIHWPCDKILIRWSKWRLYAGYEMVANKEKTPKQQQLKRAQNINIKECLLGFFVGINLILWTICSIKTYKCVHVFESCGTNTSIFLLGLQKFLNYYNIAEVKFLRIQYVYIKELMTYN